MYHLSPVSRETQTTFLLVHQNDLTMTLLIVRSVSGLLPEDNYEDDSVGALSAASLASMESQGAATSSQSSAKGIKTKRLVRGCS